MIPEETREPFNHSMDSVLLSHDFSYYNDWDYGPMSLWSTGWEHHSMKLMRHDFGYWIILSNHCSGKNKTLNMGSSNNADDIIAIRDTLKKLW